MFKRTEDGYLIKTEPELIIEADDDINDDSFYGIKLFENGRQLSNSIEDGKQNGKSNQTNGYYSDQDEKEFDFKGFDSFEINFPKLCGIFSCHYCQLHFKNTKSYYAHATKRHNVKTFDKNRNSFVTKFECNFCDKSMPNVTEWRIHERLQHISVNTFTCDICNKSFSLKSELIKHFRIHTGNIQIKCLKIMK